MKLLILIGLQKESIYGALQIKEGEGFTSKIVEKIESLKNNKNYDIIFFREERDLLSKENIDELSSSYRQGIFRNDLDNSDHLELCEEIKAALNLDGTPYKKEYIADKDTLFEISLEYSTYPEEIILIGTYTDIDIISNAFALSAFFPQTQITVWEDCCLGTSKEAHDTAVNAMNNCYIKVTGAPTNDKRKRQ